MSVKPKKHDTESTKTKSKKPSVRFIVLGIIFALCLAVIIGGIICNNDLRLNEISVTSQTLPESFEGFRIAHVSDLHNASFGKDNERLLNMLRDAEPDMIAITGDMIDSYRTDIDVAVKFAEEAVKIAPCYYVAGNHESRISELGELLDGLSDAGVAILRDDTAELSQNDEHILIVGVDDPDFRGADYLLGGDSADMDRRLKTLKYAHSNGFTLLLSHRPELFETYVYNNMDIVLSGHAHGGQFRLPFVGGLYAPDQGLFPKYDGGVYTEGNTTMIVSRGVGNSLFPLRLFNNPEVILIELSRA